MRTSWAASKMLQSAALECCAVCHGRREESAEESAEESWSIVKYSFTDIGEFGLGREWQIYFFYSRSFESGYSLSEYPLDRCARGFCEDVLWVELQKPLRPTWLRMRSSEPVASATT